MLQGRGQVDISFCVIINFVPYSGAINLKQARIACQKIFTSLAVRRGKKELSDGHVQ